MLSKKIEEKLDCVVTGLTNFGVFVQSRKFGIEGLIQMADLGPERWRFDSKTQSIVGQGSGQSIHLGQAIKVRIVSVNVPARQLNVAPVEPLAKASMLRAKGKSAKKSKKVHTRKRSKGRK
jgi:ribonuclease R